MPASLPIPYALGSSPPVAGSFRDALLSYRRSQYLVANSKVVSTPDRTNPLEQPGDLVDHEEEDMEVGGHSDHARVHHRGSFDGLDMDDPDLDPSVGRGIVGSPSVSMQATGQLHTHTTPTPIIVNSRTHELSSLLHKPITFSDAPCPGTPLNHTTTENLSDPVTYQSTGHLVRRCSSGSSKSPRYIYAGKSTFGQTLFNSIAILVGVGMLSEPLAFAYAGWVGGTLLILFYAFIACYTAKILARIILEDPRLRSYSDIGLKAFGPRSTLLTGALFCLELFAVSVLLVTLFADSLYTISPAYSADAYKILGLIVLIPTMFMPLSLLSYTSILGILSTLLIIMVILIDGFSKREGPGSLWSPAETSLGVKSIPKLGVAFGLFMAGFSGHAVIPSLARDMINPQEFDKMINWAFVVATFTYASIGYAGYLMFGNAVSEEISMDLLQTPGYHAVLNQAVLWTLVVSPLTKFALSTRPINVIIETFFGLDPNPLSVSAECKRSSPHDELPLETSNITIKQILIVAERTLLPILSVGVSILIPNFSSMMAFLGSFAAITICVIGPIAAHIALTGRCRLFDGFVLLITSIMAIWGTIAVFLGM